VKTRKKLILEKINVRFGMHARLNQKVSSINTKKWNPTKNKFCLKNGGRLIDLQLLEMHYRKLFKKTNLQKMN
jgi:hypothetical protein